MGVFTIQERRRIGGVTIGSQAPNGGERFVWTTDRNPVTGEKGGARSAPVKGWEMGGMQRAERTDYPGAKHPSVQVLGPKQKDQQFTGQWDDRYNYEGFAVAEMRRFEEMCERGNLIEIQFEDQAFEGIIVDWTFPYKGAWFIGYSFTLQVHSRIDAAVGAAASIQTALSPYEAFDQADLATQGLVEITDDQPKVQLTSELNEVSSSVDNCLVNRNALADSMDQSELRPSLSADNQLRQFTANYVNLGASAMEVMDALETANAVDDLAVLSPFGLLAYEEWTRDMRYMSRVLLRAAQLGAASCQVRTGGPAEQTYRPFAGESLYSVSRRFYGTPHSWRLIADRNDLTTFKLTGDELLIIPERGMG